MKATWLILSFLLNPYASNGESARNHTTDAFYEDVKELFPCVYRNCITHDNRLSSDGCDCGIQCKVFDTCCPDSIYRNIKTPQLKPSCRSIKNSNSRYLMIDQCPTEEDSDAALKQLCVMDDYRVEDLMRQVPVTSLVSNVTYKNYFCFKCNELNKDFVFWHLLIESSSKPDTEVRNESITLSYNSIQGTWMATTEKDGAMFMVGISIQPNYARAQAKCFRHVTSTCSEEWKDNETRNKCNAYTTITKIKKNNSIRAYRNPHCALCNFEDLNLTDCTTYTKYTGGDGAGGTGFSFSFLFDTNISGGNKVGMKHSCNKPSVWDPLFKKCRPFIPLFSFTHLLDINSSEGSTVGKRNLCDETFVWDPFFKKCRLTGCAVAGYIIRNGTCVPP